jgi:hypothetical protein
MQYIKLAAVSQSSSKTPIVSEAVRGHMGRAIAAVLDLSYIRAELTGARRQNASAEVYKAVARYSAIIANVHSEPPVGTAPPMARRARPPLPVPS